MSNVSHIGVIKLLKAVKRLKEEVVPIAARMQELNKEFSKTIEYQKVLNKHLAERNEVYRKLNEKKEKPKLCLVK